MCRPIESRESLGIIGPANLFNGYRAPDAGLGNVMNMPKPNGTMHGASNLMTLRAKSNLLPSWSPASASINSSSFVGYNGSEAMNLMPMNAPPPPSLPFVSFPKSNSAPMPWMNPGMMNGSNGVVGNDYVPPFSFEEGILNEMKPADIGVAAPAFEQIREANNAIEAAELEDLLEFAVPDESTVALKDKEDLLNLDDGFDGTEMSILYSFLVDAPEEKKKVDVSDDDGLLNLNLLGTTPLESFMDCIDEDLTDDELKLVATSPPHAEMFLEKPKKEGEMKSRRLCKAEDCYKRSRSNGLCISHGGGRRCAIDGCDKSSQGGNLCIRHGGGKRCKIDGCDKAAQSNFLCKAHGGGPRCQYKNCSRSSQGGGFCRSHGGGKRCLFDGCTKGTQRGDYCALHGGSRLCEVPGCMRNDRGGGLCATHGGGKRCSTQGCGKPCRRKGLCSAHLRLTESALK